MKKIISLTAGQEREREAYLQKTWKEAIQPGLGDRKLIEWSVREMYAITRNSPPDVVLFVDGPRAAAAVVSDLRGGHRQFPETGEYWRGPQSCVAAKPKSIEGDTFHRGFSEIGWTCYYGFCRDVLGCVYARDSELRLHENLVANCGRVWTYEHLCVVSARPTALKFSRHESIKDRRLHCDGGAAVEYADGASFYYLNGVRVPRHVAITPATQLNPAIALSETNVEVRREIVRKIGVERLEMLCGSEVLDAEGDYTLVLLHLPDGRRRPYLKMKNPSIGVWHMEGVPPNTGSVQEALRFRNGTNDRPQQLT